MLLLTSIIWLHSFDALAVLLQMHLNYLRKNATIIKSNEHWLELAFELIVFLYLSHRVHLDSISCDNGMTMSMYYNSIVMNFAVSVRQ